MSRDAHIPLALWISAALLFHVVGGESAVEVAQVVEDRAQLRAVVRAVRSELRPPDTTFEILLDDSAPSPPAEALPSSDNDAPAADPDKADPDAANVEAPKKPPPPPKKLPEKKPEVEPKKPEPPKDEPPKPPPPEKKPEPLPAVPLAPLAPAPPPPPPPPPDERIAVRQHAAKDQEDNPAASRIADDANHVAEETVAHIRSHDQDSEDPTPGAAHSGPKGSVGDSDHDDLAQSENKAGDPDHAPGEAAPRSTSAEHASPTPAAKGPVVAKAAPASQAGQRNAAGTTARAPEPPTPPAAGGAGPASPEATTAERGSYTLDPANPGGDGKSRVAGLRRQPDPFRSPVDVSAGAPGIARLSMAGVEAAVGDKQLKAEREADGASRRSAHRGSWETNKFQRWRAAIENYEPSVKLGNQTALNAARVPFATYINTIHNRLHPIFAEEFLASLDSLPTSHTLNEQDLATHIEIVLSKDEGRIVRLGVTKASGVTAFDIAALNAVSRGSPYGKAPDAVVSPDGNVYLHWEFHRDPFDACTTRHARPFLLKAAPEVPQPVGPPRRRPASDDPRGEGPLVPLREP